MVWKAKQLVKIIHVHGIDKIGNPGSILTVEIGANVAQMTKKIVGVLLQFRCRTKRGKIVISSIIGEGLYYLRFDDSKGHFTEIVNLIDVSYANYWHEVEIILAKKEMPEIKQPVLSKASKKNKANEILLFARQFGLADG